VLALTGCSGIPDSGPVVAVDPQEEPTVGSPGRVEPASPMAGASRDQVVRGFMDAMQAYPVSTDVAREFLSRDSADSWLPSRATVIYQSLDFGETPGGVVEMQVVEQARLGAQGAYSPAIAGQQREPVQWELVQEGGEWRIANPPDELYISTTHFEKYYRSYNLYFLEPTQKIAVGVPAYFPYGEQLATSLVRALLDAPSPATARHLRTAIPSRASLDVPIPIQTDGVAEVSLIAPEERLSEQQAELLSVQVVSTLRQVPGLLGVRILLNEAPLDIGDSADVQDVSSWAFYVPAANVVERRLFALAGGQLVTIEGASIAPVEAPVGQQPQDLRWVVVNQSTQQLLGVSRDGRRIVTGPVGDTEEALTPVWDQAMNLGRPSDAGDSTVVVDRTADGSRLVVVDEVDDPSARRVSLGSLAGQYVDALSVSPDGVRFVAVASDSRNPTSQSRLLTGWLTRGRAGQITGVSGVLTLTLPGEQLVDVRDAGWVGENRLAFIGRFADSPMEIYTVDTDGSNLSGGQVSGEPLPEELDPVWLATAGLEEAPIYAAGRDGTLWLRADDDEWQPVSGERLRSATFAN
jgi:hypothetical protein